MHPEGGGAWFKTQGVEKTTLSKPNPGLSKDSLICWYGEYFLSYAYIKTTDIWLSPIKDVTIKSFQPNLSRTYQGMLPNSHPYEVWVSSSSGFLTYRSVAPPVPNLSNFPNQLGHKLICGDNLSHSLLDFYPMKISILVCVEGLHGLGSESSYGALLL